MCLIMCSISGNNIATALRRPFCWSDTITHPLPPMETCRSFWRSPRNHVQEYSSLLLNHFHVAGYLWLFVSQSRAHINSPLQAPLKKHPSTPITLLHQLGSLSCKHQSTHISFGTLGSCSHDPKKRHMYFQVTSKDFCLVLTLDNDSFQASS